MLGWLTYKNPAFPNTPQKRPNRGWYGSRGVFPYSGGESLTQAHTGGTAGTIRLCCLLVFGISSFSEPLPKILFFVYAAQFLHRAIFPSSTLITFCRTLLEYYESLFVFCTAIECAFSNRLKTGPNRRCYEFGYCFSTSTRKASHRSTQAVTQGVPAWLSYLMLSSSVHPEIFSPSAAGGIAPPLPGLGGW